MPVSSGLQKYFDSQQKKKSKREIKEKFASLSGDINPVFLQSFEGFHDRIMQIVDENPDQTVMIGNEVEKLGEDMSDLQKHHNNEKHKKMLSLI